MDVGKKFDVEMSLRNLNLRKIAILQEEKQFWCLQRRKGEKVARRVIEHVEGVVKDAIGELEGQESNIASKSYSTGSVFVLAKGEANAFQTN